VVTVTDLLTVRATGRTDKGLVRRRNEDAYYAGTHLFAVADGLGGHVSGDIASGTAIEAIRRFDLNVDPLLLRDTLGRAVDAANRDLAGRIEQEPDTAGMGTTLVMLLLSGNRAALANVGDSRAYVRRAGRPTRQITEDHVFANMLAQSALVPNLPEKLSRFLNGRAGGLSADLTETVLHPGDRVLLCSDGLSSYVPADIIDNVIRQVADPDEAAKQLVAAALEHGGHDNVTVVVLDF
jgi:serine/threonine protein phosphatase PrpC